MSVPPKRSLKVATAAAEVLVSLRVVVLGELGERPLVDALALVRPAPGRGGNGDIEQRIGRDDHADPRLRSTERVGRDRITDATERLDDLRTWRRIALVEERHRTVLERVHEEAARDRHVVLLVERPARS